MIILQKILAMILEFFVGKAIDAAKEKGAENERRQNADRAASELEKAKLAKAPEQELIDRELDVLNGSSKRS